MIIKNQKRKWHWFVLIAFFAMTTLAAAYFIRLPLRNSDKLEASRSLVAWIVEGRSVPGFRRPYPDSKWMPEMKHFFVISDTLPSDFTLSDDPRVRRIHSKDYKETFKKHGYNNTDYISIEIQTESEHELSFEFANMLGSMAGHGYDFTFHRGVFGLFAIGKFKWVS